MNLNKGLGSRKRGEWEMETAAGLPVISLGALDRLYTSDCPDQWGSKGGPLQPEAGD